MENGEFLIYLDFGCTINKQGASRLLEYLHFADSSPCRALFFQLQGCIEREWTVHQLFEYFDLSLDSHIALSGQCIGTVLIIKKNPNVISLLERCLQTVKDDVFLITDDYVKAGQKTYFKDHRHDQSIFSLVAKLSGAYIIPNETWYIDFSCKEAEKIPFLATRIKK